MGVNIVVEKAKTETGLEQQVTLIPAGKTEQALVSKTHSQTLAEELILLQRKLLAAEVPEITKRMDTIKKELQSIAAAAISPYDVWVIDCDTGKVQLSACKHMTAIADKDGVLKYIEDKVGKDALASVIQINLTDLKKVLSENEIAKFVTDTPGSRTTTIVVANKGQ